MRRRGVPQLGLSFLDCMSCGLGAVVLLFMILHHASTVRATESNREVAREVSLLESEVLEKRRTAAAMASALEETREEIAAAAALAASLETSVSREGKASASRDDSRLESLEEELRGLERDVAALREQAGDATRHFAGEGDRLYLTGLRVEGDRVLVLVDASASMLGETIVDVVRRRNMAAERRRAAPKWRRAVATVDWITTRIAPDARFQIYAFGVDARPLLAGTADRWIAADGGRRVTEAVEALRGLVPAGGTNLEAAFRAAARLAPKPDAVYLLTDGLPTQSGSGGARGTVSGEQRLRRYRDATAALPAGVPVHVILFPMEGDPLAASVFWQLAHLSGGAFLSPPGDWP